MKLYYKLTDQRMKTRDEYQWGMNMWHIIDPNLQDINASLCTKHWFHVYTHPLLAILLNPIHANIADPRLFRCVCAGLNKSARGLKVGFTKVRLTSEIELPKITLIQSVAFGVLCAKNVYSEVHWAEWADEWLSKGGIGIIKTAEADVEAAAQAAIWATQATTQVTMQAAAEAVAQAAAWAVQAADDGKLILNLINIAKKALEY